MQQLLDFYQQEIYNPRQIQYMMRIRENVGPWGPSKEIDHRTQPLINNKKVEDFLSTILNRKYTRLTEIQDETEIRNQRRETSRHKSQSALASSIIPKFNTNKPKNTNSNQAVKKQSFRTTIRNADKKILDPPRIQSSPKGRSKSTAIQIQVLPHNPSWNEEKIYEPSLPRFNIWKNVLKNQREKKKARIDRSLFYLGSATKYDWNKVGEVKMRVKPKAGKQISTHLTYNNLPHQKLLRMKSKQEEERYWNISGF